MIEMLDHTADVGFELRTSTLEGLFDEARRALLMVVFELPPEEGRDGREILLSAPDRETLLVRWMNEIAYLIQDGRFVPVGAEIRIQKTGGVGYALEARLTRAPLPLGQDGGEGEVKSAT